MIRTIWLSLTTSSKKLALDSYSQTRYETLRFVPTYNLKTSRLRVLVSTMALPGSSQLSSKHIHSQFFTKFAISFFWQLQDCLLHHVEKTSSKTLSSLRVPEIPFLVSHFKFVTLMPFPCTFRLICVQH